MTWEFLITALTIVLLPGTGMIYTLAVGLGQGTRRAAIAAFGCTLGIVPHLAASILGLVALLHASAIVFQIVKVAGVVFLFWMAWNVWRRGGGRRDMAHDRVGACLHESDPRGLHALRGYSTGHSPLWSAIT